MLQKNFLFWAVKGHLNRQIDLWRADKLYQMENYWYLIGLSLWLRNKKLAHELKN